MNTYGFFKVAGAIPTVQVGNCSYNAERHIELINQAAEKGVELVVFPELSLTGCTCGDLFLQPTLQRGAEEALRQILEATAALPIAVIVGMPLMLEGRRYNCALCFAEGELLGAVPKCHIPHYGESAEGRWFGSGLPVEGQILELLGQEIPMGRDVVFRINGVKCGVEIGEDFKVPTPPANRLAQAGAEVIVTLAAAPEMVGRNDYLKELVRLQSTRLKAGSLYVSAGFGESSTDLVFGGHVLIADQGEWLAQSRRFQLEEQLVTAEIDVECIGVERARTNTFATTEEAYTLLYCDCEFSPGEARFERTIDPMPFVPADAALREARCEEIFEIQALGLAKRLVHTHCRQVVMGISGGLDSTLALLVAVKAFDKLGYDRQGIHGITMPGFGTTDRTYRNALDLMTQLGISQREISIVKAVKQHFADIELDPEDRSATYENSQARERTQILMDYANKVGGLVVGTGDLSELALGWATYNGDQMSMYGVNASIPKTLVRHLVRWVAEREGGAVGATLLDVVDTPVSPELLPANERGEIAQKTEDLVGPYELHDFVLYHFIRRGASPRKLLFLAEQAFGERYSRAVILHWLETFFRRFFSQQFKRSAMPDGPKVGSVGLSPRGDWQMPSDGSAAVWMSEIEALKRD